MDWLKQKFELARGGEGHNVPSMEGLRGFAVFVVFLVHYVELVAPWISGNPGLLAFADSLHSIGKIGVELFFVLSGYLIYGSLMARNQSYVRFMSRRVERIYPAFIAVYVLYLGLSFAFPAQNKIPPAPIEGAAYLIENFLLLPGLFPIAPMIGVAWSLSYEIFFYLAIPLVIALLRLREWSRAGRATLFLVVAGATVAYCAVSGGHIRLILFISGMLLFEAIESPRIPTPTSLVGFVALAAGMLSTLLPFEGSAGTVLKVCIRFIAFFVLGLACFRAPSAWLSRWFSWTPIRWLGNMSYSYYLIHGVALAGAFMALSFALHGARSYGPWLFWILLPVMFVLTLVPAAGLFLLVERPFSLAPRKRASPNVALQPTTIDAGEPDAPQAARRLP